MADAVFTEAPPLAQATKRDADQQAAPSLGTTKLFCTLCKIDMSQVAYDKTYSLVDLAQLTGVKGRTYCTMRFCSIECAANEPYRTEKHSHIADGIRERVEKHLNRYVLRQDLRALRCDLVLTNAGPPPIDDVAPPALQKPRSG